VITASVKLNSPHITVKNTDMLLKGGLTGKRYTGIDTPGARTTSKKDKPPSNESQKKEVRGHKKTGYKKTNRIGGTIT